MTKDLERSRLENETLKDRFGVLSESEKRATSHAEQEICRLKEQESLLRETLERLRVNHEEVTSKSRALEERLNKVEGQDLMTLKSETSEAKAKAKELKAKLLRTEKSNALLKADKEAANEQLKTEEAARDKVTLALLNQYLFKITTTNVTNILCT